MKTQVLTLFLTCLLVNIFSQQKTTKLELPLLNRSTYIGTLDSTTIQLKTADKVTSNLGFTIYDNTNYSRTYKGIEGSKNPPIFTTFITQTYTAKDSFNINISDSIFILKKNQKFHIYGFTTYSSTGKKVSQNYSKLFISAYLQEINDTYKGNKNNFTTIPRINKAIFWKRNLINMGYGFSYLSKKNPFIEHKKLGIGTFYVFEALHYIPIFGGAFFGNTKKDKIMIPIIGFSSLLIWKGLFSGLIIGRSHIKRNKKILNSGYRIPADIRLN